MNALAPVPASDPAGAASVQTLDAFGFWPNSGSRIHGLGGTAIDPDPAYAFHTQYHDLGNGLVTITLRFDRLEASLGAMIVRINGLPPGPQVRAETIRTWTVQLRDIADGEGVHTLTFETTAGTRYAVLGHIYGEADARAAGLSIVAETAPIDESYADKLAKARKSVFGRRMFRRASRLVSDGKATLADPVSQGCTNDQFDEPAYARWLGEMRVPMHRHRKQWEFVYILQSLHRYGMLRPGARGLGFGVGIEPLPAVMAAHGCSVVATDLSADDERARDWSATAQHAATIEQLRNPRICADDVFDRQVTYRAVDMNAIDDDLINFDFTWSSCSLEHLGSIEAGLEFIRNSIACLTFGGLAVHTTEFNLSSNSDTIDNDSTVLFRRQDLERLAVDLVSRGHYVAQFKYDFGDTMVDQHVDVPPYADAEHLKLAIQQYVTTSFGIIVRRGER